MPEIKCPHCGEDITEFVTEEANKMIASGEFDDVIQDHASGMAADFAESAREAYD